MDLAAYESNLGGYKETRIGQDVANSGNGNSFNIGAAATTGDNSYGTRIVALDRGLNSNGNGNSFNIGLLNLAAFDSNIGGYKETRIGQDVANSGNGNSFNIGAAADTTNNQYGTRIVALDRGLNSNGNGNSFNIGLI